MDARETLIDRINQKLAQLPEAHLDIVYRLVQRLGLATNDKALEQVDQSEAFPFVDEIERVREQSRQISGGGNDQQFA